METNPPPTLDEEEPPVVATNLGCYVRPLASQACSAALPYLLFLCILFSVLIIVGTTVSVKYALG
jgi:hypothetical protein